MTWNGVDLSGLLGTLASILTALLGWVAVSIKKKQAAAAEQSKAETSLLKLAAIAAGLAGKAWDTLSPDIQAALADGKMTPEERLHIEAHVGDLLKEFADGDELKQIAEALGLPLPGLVAKIAAMLIEKFAFAHDPTTPAQSKLEFPVSSTPGSSTGEIAGG